MWVHVCSIIAYKELEISSAYIIGHGLLTSKNIDASFYEEKGELSSVVHLHFHCKWLLCIIIDTVKYV